MAEAPLSQDAIEAHNSKRRGPLEEDYHALARTLRRRGLDADGVKSAVLDFSIALPSWATGRGGTRFAKFAIPGEPTNIHEKLMDCELVQQLCRATPRVSLHFPWDSASDYVGLHSSRQGNIALPEFYLTGSNNIDITLLLRL